MNSITIFRWLVLCCTTLVTTATFSQSFCEDFSNPSSTAPVGNACTGVYQPGMLDNWGAQNIDALQYTDVNSQGGSGDFYLFLDDGSCGNGGTVAFNDVDYSGNWLTMVPQEEGCFCFDLRVFFIATGTITGYNSLRIYNGPDPGSSTVSAVFTLTTPIDVSQGWVRICAPIALSSGGVLPGNADGQWTVNTGNAADWDTLVQNVGSLAFGVDVAGGDERWGIDNICISEKCDATVGGEPEPTPDGAFCCDESENLVNNGNFEFGNTGFASSYTQNAATLPGQYDVTNSAAAFGTTVTDHSFCADPVAYPNNDQFLLVNGRTTQAAGSSSVIWRQSVTLDPEKEYRFCANFKNLPQCTFDILPQLTIETSSGYTQTLTVNTDPSDPCDWQMESFCFRGDQRTAIRIRLAEDGLGDGNDLAIDDISVQELVDPNLSITVQHQGNPQQVTGSLNTISTADDVLPYNPDICQEPWYWYVITLDSASGGSFVIDFSEPFGWGNNTGYSLFNPSTSGTTPWNLTTNFLPFPFQQNTLYLVGMTTPSCCEDCTDDGFTYQVIYNNQAPMGVEEGLTQAQKDWIRSWLGTYGSVFGDKASLPSENSENVLEMRTSAVASEVMVYPNPAKEVLHITNNNASSIQAATIVDVNGKQVQQLSAPYSEANIEHLTSGLYFIHLKMNDSIISKKFIKE
ncbi:T9SS type A sorting domain-containing protein [Altibacter sp. HG106]|uniref:T9SS type A sorting domain-containing protein n=1 Tax=Altibacter sp. HG106 TaxID=3023937 RepID=UPI002350B9F2|nr:T9SS type A sorting domain-containing protein [Altibacter sp. HG106]MDC7993892.1 T9SS type A sorting domain-containing protein [Altibacter sp. HG106]